MNGGTVILVLGIGGAVFLYFRAQQQAAAALAAAQAAPGPTTLGKLENTVKQYGGAAVKAVEQVPGAVTRTLLSGATSGWRAVSSAPGAVAGGVASAVVGGINTIRGIF